METICRTQTLLILEKEYISIANDGGRVGTDQERTIEEDGNIVGFFWNIRQGLEMYIPQFFSAQETMKMYKT